MLARDPIWQVRQSAVRTLGNMAYAIASESRTLWTGNWFDTFINDHSRNVRDSTWENIGQIAAAFLPDAAGNTVEVAFAVNGSFLVLC